MSGVRHLDDDELDYWLLFHQDRIAREMVEIERNKAAMATGDDLMSEDYRTALIAGCWHAVGLSERALGEIQAEMATRFQPATPPSGSESRPVDTAC